MYLSKFNYYLGLISLSLISNNVLASPLSFIQSEENLVQKYKNADFYEVNHEFMAEAVRLIQQDPLQSFNYPFSSMKEEMHLTIHFPKDQSFKVYTFDVGGGGTMGEYQSYVQFKSVPNPALQELETGFVRKIDQISLDNQPVYLLSSYYKGSSCVGLYSLQAFKVNNHQLVKANIFKTKSKKLSEIDVDYDCHHDDERQGDYIQLSKDLKTLDIQFLDEQYKPQAKVIRYQLNKDGYRYQGIVKK